MTIDYQLKPEEFIVLQTKPPFTSVSLAKWYYYGIMPALCAGLAMAADSLMVAVIFTLLYLGTSWFIQRLIRKAYKRAVFTADNMSFHVRPWRATISDEGIRFSCDAVESFYRWSYIRTVAHDSQFVEFMLTPIVTLQIPVRAFDDKEHLQKFIDTAQSHIKLHAPKPEAFSAIAAKP